jgi:hypothetical protein
MAKKFDAIKFMSSEFSPREGEVLVPDMAEWFEGSKEDAKLIVRGLTGNEFAIAQDAVSNTNQLMAMIEAIASKSKSENIKGFKAMLGGVEDGDTHNEIVIRIETLVLGSVEPKFDEGMAARFARTYPIEFYKATNKINQLTGQGQVPGKRKSSGKKVKSS